MVEYYMQMYWAGTFYCGGVVSHVTRLALGFASHYG